VPLKLSQFVPDVVLHQLGLGFARSMADELWEIYPDYDQRVAWQEWFFITTRSCQNT